MLPHLLSEACWCHPKPHHSGIWMHRHLCLTYDPQPRAAILMIDGIPV